MNQLSFEDGDNLVNENDFTTHTTQAVSSTGRSASTATAASSIITIDEDRMDDIEILTVTDFRSAVAIQNPGFQFIAIGRENFLEQVLGIYKDPNFNFFRTTKIQFMGEAGNQLRNNYSLALN